MLADWTCEYCKTPFTTRAEWVEHLKDCSDIEEAEIVEPIDRAEERR